jgi:MFS family permease
MSASKTSTEAALGFSAPEKSSYRAWVVCLAASLFFFYEFVQMMMFNAINPSLMQTFHVSASAVGKISSSYFYANVLFMFPAGILLDRYSTKRLILIAMVLCLGGTLLFSFSSSVSSAMLFRFLTGVGGSFPFLACLRLASRWFPARRLALVSGVVVTVAMLGGVAGQTPMTFLVHLFGWRHALQCDALLGVVFSIIIFFKVHDFPKGSAQQKTNTSTAFDLRAVLKDAIFNKQNWLFGLYTSLLNLPIMLLGAIWGSLYLVQIFHLSKTQASLVTSMLFFGTIVGAPLFGWLSDRIGRRILPMWICGLLSLGVIFIVMYVTSLSFSELILFFFLLGFVTSAQVISYPAIAESNPGRSAASALGLASVLIMLAPAIFQPVFGQLMDWHWNGLRHHGVAQYSLANFHVALWIFPVAFVLAVVLVLLAKETFCRHRLAVNNKS